MKVMTVYSWYLTDLDTDIFRNTTAYSGLDVVQLLIHCSLFKISSHYRFIVSENIYQQTDTLNQGQIHQRQF